MRLSFKVGAASQLQDVQGVLRWRDEWLWVALDEDLFFICGAASEGFGLRGKNHMTREQLSFVSSELHSLEFMVRN